MNRDHSEQQHGISCITVLLQRELIAKHAYAQEHYNRTWKEMQCSYSSASYLSLTHA